MERLREVAALFLKLGFTAFGGPAAHIGIMHDEIVKRRKWLDDQRFLDLLGATNLIPGPNSTEMAIHVGFLQAGWPGLFTAGVCFVAPATLIVLFLAWAYVKFGALPQAQWLLYGIKPVVIAIILQAIWNLGRRATRNWLLAVSGLLILLVYFFLHINEIALLFGGGLAVMLVANMRRLGAQDIKRVLVAIGGRTGSVLATQNEQTRQPSLSNIFATLESKLSQVTNWQSHIVEFSNPVIANLFSVPFSLPVLFLTFLKIGSILYGSGYVLLAFLRGFRRKARLADRCAVA